MKEGMQSRSALYANQMQFCVTPRGGGLLHCIRMNHFVTCFIDIFLTRLTIRHYSTHAPIRSVLAT